jgi:hypothetical protein
MIARFRITVTRWQNRLLSVLLSQEFEEMNVYSYPRGDQLRKALEADPAGCSKTSDPLRLASKEKRPA